jgi:hypothetical protein
MDVREAFESSLKTRGRKVSPPSATGKGLEKLSSFEALPFNPNEGAEMPKVNIKQNVKVRTRRTDDGDTGSGEWATEIILAFLEEACGELGYSLDKIEDMLTSGKYPQELIDLVVFKSGCSDVPILVEILNSQKVSLLAKIIALKKLNTEVKSSIEMKAQEKIRHLGKCPMSFDWIKIPGGYRCAGGTHFVSDIEIEMTN